MSIKFIKLLIVSVVLSHGSQAFAKWAWYQGKVTDMLVDDSSYGQCMVKVDDPAVMATCPNTWVSLDCEGNVNSKDVARRMWDTAQMAFAMDLDVKIKTTDAVKINGYCVGIRVVIGK
ncbi:hypothetical protein N9Q38_00970 [Pseudomonadales bacterium]|nr:hypothetical protein [Pseudomonadales bacterium]